MSKSLEIALTAVEQMSIKKADRDRRVVQMSEEIKRVFRDRGECFTNDLIQAGFSSYEISAYSSIAMDLISIHTNTAQM